MTVLVFGFAAPAMADDFGPRFSGNPPAAFLDGGMNVFLGNIEPAAGGSAEDDAALLREGAAAIREEEQDMYREHSGGDNPVVRVYPEPLDKSNR